MTQPKSIKVGVLALQGAFIEHISHLNTVAKRLNSDLAHVTIVEVRTPAQLMECQALVIPGGESTSISLVAERTGLLEPLRDFVKKFRLPVWGTCAGMILLAEEATKTKKGGQELIGGLDVRVIRNHFGRQADSFTMELDLPFLEHENSKPFQCVFIRAPIVDAIIDTTDAPNPVGGDITAPSVKPLATDFQLAPVKILAQIPAEKAKSGKTTIVAVEQGNVFGTSFHPELTNDLRLHEWWLKKVMDIYD